eukprot:CAMPEP_0185688842 /NCGR_PEP_ID=MMETSP1164-20130828/89_1 /TAXON_ID=1104430 /ORGANISM="Chrysoreinhardia sp, Strain CCMP2950" /LENGTH=92 /DNA_ID=CAMNT_0028355311 /DNA_START=27 /DNA_END=301 /DNA_ORIENTATION=+
MPIYSLRTAKEDPASEKRARTICDDDDDLLYAEMGAQCPSLAQSARLARARSSQRLAKAGTMGGSSATARLHEALFAQPSLGPRHAHLVHPT